MISAPVQDVQGRTDSFGFVCSRCSRCCYDKIIQVNPYEVARLGRSLGVTSGEFAARHTDQGLGVHLTRRDDGACEFLGPQGCTVHADRPLVCRLYPLGRHVSDDGSERFSRMTPHPQSEGEFTRDGTIADYLQAQGAGPFMAAADAYFTWTCRAKAALDAAEDQDDLEDRLGEVDLLDMDAAIAQDCAASGAPEPADIESRLELHLEILDRRLAEVEPGRQA